MKCSNCSQELNLNMKAAFDSNVCPFCGSEILLEFFVREKDRVLNLIKTLPPEQAALMIALKLQSTFPSDEISLSSRVEVPEMEDPSVEEQDVDSSNDDVEDEYIEDEMSDEDRKAWELMAQGKAEEFFYEDAQQPPARTLAGKSSAPTPSLQGRSDGMTERHAVMDAIRSLESGSADLPEGFDSPSLLPKRTDGSGLINRK